MIATLMLLAMLQGQGRESLGVFDSWGAFRDAAPARCFAIGQPVQGGRAAFASVANWPRSGARNQLYIRLSRARDPRAKVTLSVGERRFELIAGASDAWAPDARTDLAIVTAMRSSRSMSVESLARGGGAFADVYALKGAATAIDAAAMGCARR
ncbi:hypothetical protein M9978_04585 [Sphingomonas sp. MG17]|jgi:hypothetical protein|uniref:Invasion protein IalB, involved in pathogenesis n=1 Tax=Sphingomonas tagetis TaxID=2949092 RepID=A0A9X2KJP4_9SPHN|nr:hypothetical protein [Sphingomonas tagetis]MCP3729699.1 hypothetical protein [Sphingomonas tagetis]